MRNDFKVTMGKDLDQVGKLFNLKRGRKFIFFKENDDEFRARIMQSNLIYLRRGKEYRNPVAFPKEKTFMQRVWYEIWVTLFVVGVIMIAYLIMKIAANLVNGNPIMFGVW